MTFTRFPCSWLDNPTFRGMRQSLMRSFNQIYVLDLHGSTKRKERAPDGSRDENVFDIKQGVAISIFVKRPDLERGVWRGDLWGRRLDKYAATASGRLASLVPARLEPAAPGYLFLQRDAAIGAEYDAGWRMTDIFATHVLGFQTHRDAFAISFTDAEMRRKLADLADRTLPDDELKRRYGLRSNRDWSLPDAREGVRNGQAQRPSRVAYRPFDPRWSEFSGLTMDYPRRELLDHVAGRGTLCLLVPRQIGAAEWRHAFVVDTPADNCLISTETKAANHVFPLARFEASGDSAENMTAPFRAFLDERYAQHYGADEIAGYIYAVLHATTYRTRYLAFLRADFPRIPFPESADTFEALARLGWDLIEAHLLRRPPTRGLAAYHGQGNHRVQSPRYVAAEEAVWINATQRFAPVPQGVWDLHVGSHQVLDKYLKARKDRVLSLDEINHLAAVADSLAATLDQVRAVDAAYAAAFRTLR